MSAVQARLAQARELVRKRAAEKAKIEAAESAAAGSDDLDETTVKDDEDEVDADLDGLSDDLDATEMEDEEVPPDEEDEEEEPPPPPPADDDDDDNDEDLPPSDDDEDLPPSDDEEVPPSDDDEPPPSDDAEEKSLVIEDEEIDDEDLPPSDDDEAPSSTSSSSRGGKKKKSTMHHDLHDEASRRAVRMDARKAKRLAAEMQDVTFQPSTNKGKRKGKKGAGGATKSGSSGSAHRRLHNPRSVQEKAERAAKAREREAKRDCSFNPVISAKARAMTTRSDERFDGILSVHDRLHLDKVERMAAHDLDPECTFQPKTTSTVRRAASSATFSRLYSSHGKTKERREVARARAEKERLDAEIAECTFAPKRLVMQKNGHTEVAKMPKRFGKVTQNRLYEDGLALMQKRKDAAHNKAGSVLDARAAKLAEMKADRKKTTAGKRKTYSRAWCDAQSKEGARQVSMRRNQGTPEMVAKKNAAAAREMLKANPRFAGIQKVSNGKIDAMYEAGKKQMEKKNAVDAKAKYKQTWSSPGESHTGMALYPTNTHGIHHSETLSKSGPAPIKNKQKRSARKAKAKASPTAKASPKPAAASPKPAAASPAAASPAAASPAAASPAAASPAAASPAATTPVSTTPSAGGSSSGSGSSSNAGSPTALAGSSVQARLAQARALVAKKSSSPAQ